MAVAYCRVIVADNSIRLRILKDLSVRRLICSRMSCRQFDPVADTESYYFMGEGLFRFLSCRQFDPVADTERAIMWCVVSCVMSVADNSIRLRILKAGGGERAHIT